MTRRRERLLWQAQDRPRRFDATRRRKINAVLPEPVPPPAPSRSFDDARSLALRIAEVISDTPAANTLVMDIHDLSPFADFFVICSGDNERQLRAITREVVEKLSEDGRRPERTEGTPVAGWILLDFGEVIVHIFGAEQRAYYRLEQLWSEAPTLLTIE